MRVEFYGGAMDGAVRDLDALPIELRFRVGKPVLRPWDIAFRFEVTEEWVYDLTRGPVNGEWRYVLRRA
jgi:hypothetical protein